MTSGFPRGSSALTVDYHEHRNSTGQTHCLWKSSETTPSFATSAMEIEFNLWFALDMSNTRRRIMLSTCELPVIGHCFSGNILRWKRFRSIFLIVLVNFISRISLQRTSMAANRICSTRALANLTIGHLRLDASSYEGDIHKTRNLLFSLFYTISTTISLSFNNFIHLMWFVCSSYTISASLEHSERTMTVASSKKREENTEEMNERKEGRTVK